MASLIPPKRKLRPGAPKLTIPTAVPPEPPSETKTSDATDATIMPRGARRGAYDGDEEELDPNLYLDELHRAVRGMNLRADWEAPLAVQCPQSASSASSETSHTPTGRRSVHSDMSRSGSSTSEPGAFPGVDSLPGNLEVLQSLGEGASGEVAKARIVSTGMVVAIKTITTSPNPAIHRQLLRELNINQSCQCPHIVQYYGAFFQEGDTSITICMEFCEAGSMDAIYKRVRQRHGRMGEKVLVKVASSVLQGLSYLHEQRIIHRDVKPSNILVTRHGQIKLCDFGVSGELVNSVAGTFTGTSYYMAPERILGLPYTITSDVWSLGVTLLELACNRYPFPAEGEPPLGPIDLMAYITNGPLPGLQDDEAHGVRWSRALRDFVGQCLVREGGERAGPHLLTQHPAVRRAENVPDADLARFVANVWGWRSA